MRRLLMLVALVSGCDRCRGDPPPQITARPNYDANPPPNPDAPPPWTAISSLLAPDVTRRARAFPLSFGRVLLWKREPELYDVHDNTWKKTAKRPACADATSAEERLARIPDEVVFSVSASCGYDVEQDSWVPVPKLEVHGLGFAVTQLAKGNLLVTGGSDRIGDEATGHFEPRKDALLWIQETSSITTLTLSDARMGHDAIRLLDDTVLITTGAAGSTKVGGTTGAETTDAAGTGQAMMEQFSPSSSTFRPLGVQEYDGEATLLEDGRVVFLTAERCGLYDPSNASWLGCPSMNVPRKAHSFTTTAIASDRLLVVGGRDARDERKLLDSVEIYDPHDNVWTDVLALPTARADHVAVPLLDGRVVIAGGQGSDSGNGTKGALAECFLYTPEPPTPFPSPAPPDDAGDDTSDDAH